MIYLIDDEIIKDFCIFWYFLFNMEEKMWCNNLYNGKDYKSNINEIKLVIISFINIWRNKIFGNDNLILS